MIEKSYADKNMSMICAGLDNERPTIPYNARKAVVRVRKIRPEKRWQSVKIWKRRFRLCTLSTFNFVMIAGYGAVKIPPVYAFREIKAHENQVFPCIVGGQVGQTIQSLPKQASKCVENNP